MNKYYLTTAIPYVNGKPHVGHSLEYFQADVVKRYHQLLGDTTLLLSGADENALKNVQAAEKEGLPTQEYLDKYSAVWKDIYEFLGVELDVFQRGSDKKNHWPGVEKLWQLCDSSGDIYKKSYTGLYCVGCESFKTDKELVDGKCPIHETKPEQVTEENYFFRLSKYQDQLVKLVESKELDIIPDNKKAEALSFIKGGLEDFSISRSKERARGVGVPVPGDSDQIIYVWFDALDIYMTGVGFGTDEENWKKWWPADLHIIGKDINRFHTVYWPAMLLSAQLPLPKKILIHGFVNINEQKISKSVGNVIDPKEVADKFGLEALRYYMLSQIAIDSDGDFSITRLTEVYNSDLANGLGNLVARVAKLCETYKFEYHKKLPTFREILEQTEQNSWFDPSTIDLFNLTWLVGLEYKLKNFHFNEYLILIWQELKRLDRQINMDKLWELYAQLTTDLEQANKKLLPYVETVISIAILLQPFLPETAEKILKQFSGKIKSSEPLFPRI